MSPADRVYAWADGSRLVPVRALPGSDELLLADSWLVRDGRVRALDRHRARFERGCAAIGGIPAAAIAGFWSSAAALLPAEGAWFPRVELSVDRQLRLRIRVAPALGREVRVWVPPVADPRRVPHRKGPDLAAMATLRAAAAAAGADEAMLLSPNGTVLEGASSSLLWWEDDALCTPSAQLPTLPGVTTALLQERAAALGVALRHRSCGLADLAGKETWMVNALHGIRRVTAWVGADQPAGDEGRAASWSAWLDGAAVPVSG